ncbi:carbohydrate ABC transporter permease [Rhizobium sp. CBN3]|nr:carbohydrate ABC transporter permease [Rhizobium sp. CBN3]MDO3434986.1 carbohydrate ABC transporter permease [Rhizobium sp. CBN3]
MAKRNKLIGSQKLWCGIGAWTVAFLMFFPILWMLITSFKTEIDAVATPPKLLFSPTLENFADVNARADYLHYALNSVIESIGSTLLCLAIGIPAAYTAVFFPGRRTKDLLMWMLSTKMLPAVGVLVPIYLLFRDSNLLDTRSGIVIVFTLSNLPIVVWMLYSFFKDVPHEILEASRMDGASTFEQIWHLLLPLTLPGIASTALLSTILCWNEAFWSLNLTASKAGPLTAFIASFSSPEGLFWAKLSAASTLAITPILVFGWMTQRQLVRGLTFGAVK